MKIAKNNAIVFQKISDQLTEALTLQQQLKEAMELQLMKFQSQLKEELEAFKTETDVEVKKQYLCCVNVT